MSNFRHEYESRTQRSKPPSIVSDVGGLVKDIFTGTKEAVKRTLSQMLRPSEGLRNAAKVVAEPVTSAVDVWLVGEPLQESWDRFVDRQFDSRQPKVIGQLDNVSSRAVDVITSPLEYLTRSLPGESGKNEIKFDFAINKMKGEAYEYAKEISDDMLGNKKVIPPSINRPKKKRNKRKSSRGRNVRSIKRRSKPVTIHH